LTILDAITVWGALLSQPVPTLDRFRFICGFSPDMARCCWYHSKRQPLLAISRTLCGTLPTTRKRTLDVSRSEVSKTRPFATAEWSCWLRGVVGSCTTELSRRYSRIGSGCWRRISRSCLTFASTLVVAVRCDSRQRQPLRRTSSGEALPGYSRRQGLEPYHRNTVQSPGLLRSPRDNRYCWRRTHCLDRAHRRSENAVPLR